MDFMKLFQGRIARGNYFGGLVVISIVLGLVNYLVSSLFGFGMVARVLTVAVGVIGAVIGLSLVVRRLHDMGKPEWYAVLLLIPVVGFFVALWVLFTRGDAGANAYGQPQPNKTLLEAVLNR